MRPQFCNTFNVTRNKNGTEVSLNFSHVYTDHNFTFKDGNMTDVSAQLVEPVASVLVSREGAVALAKLLNRVMDDMGISLDDLD